MTLTITKQLMKNGLEFGRLQSSKYDVTPAEAVQKMEVLRSKFNATGSESEIWFTCPAGKEIFGSEHFYECSARVSL